MKKLAVGVLCLIVALDVFGATVEKPKTIRQSGSIKTGYIMSPKETAILDFLIKDEVKTFLNGGDSFLAREILSASAVDVVQAYRDNKVAADQKYLKKIVRLTGVIESIDDNSVKGAGLGEWSISMKGLPFQALLVRFHKAYWEAIQTQHVGDELVLVCDGAGVIDGITPEFDSCVFAGDYANKKLPEIRKQVVDFLAGEEPKNKKIALVAITAIAVARSLPDSSFCFSGGELCISEISSVFSKSADENKNFPAVIKELMSVGVKIAALKNDDNSGTSKEDAKPDKVLRQREKETAVSPARTGVIAVAETQSNGHIILTDVECTKREDGEQMWGLRNSHGYDIRDAFGNTIDSGCWLAKDNGYIIGVNIHGTWQKWKVGAFTKTNKLPDD